MIITHNPIWLNSKLHYGYSGIWGSQLFVLKTVFTFNPKKIVDTQNDFFKDGFIPITRLTKTFFVYKIQYVKQIPEYTLLKSYYNGRKKEELFLTQFIIDEYKLNKKLLNKPYPYTDVVDATEYPELPRKK